MVRHSLPSKPSSGGYDGLFNNKYHLQVFLKSFVHHHHPKKKKKKEGFFSRLCIKEKEKFSYQLKLIESGQYESVIAYCVKIPGIGNWNLSLHLKNTT